MSPRDRCPVRTPSPRQSSGKDHWNQWSPYNLTLLQLEQTTGLSGQRGTGPRLSLVSPKVFSPFHLRLSFGSLPLSPLACLVGDTSFPAISQTWLHRYYLNWTELDDAIIEFNNEMLSIENVMFNLVILHYWHTIFLFWFCLACESRNCVWKQQIHHYGVLTLNWPKWKSPSTVVLSH